MSQKTELPDTLRIIFEGHGVIKRPTVPLMDKLIKEIKGRGMGLDFDVAKSGFCQAEITTKGGRSFTQVADSPELSVALAFGEALKATAPRQQGLFDEPSSDSTDSAPEDVKFRDQALTAENPLNTLLELADREVNQDSPAPDTHAQMIADSLRITVDELADLLTEHGHDVIVTVDREIYGVIAERKIEDEQLSDWVGLAMNSPYEPGLVGLQSDLYRLVLVGRNPSNQFDRESAAKAFDEKARWCDGFRVEAREREQLALDDGIDGLAAYWGRVAGRWAKKVARFPATAQQLRAVDAPGESEQPADDQTAEQE